MKRSLLIKLVLIFTLFIFIQAEETAPIVETVQDDTSNIEEEIKQQNKNLEEIIANINNESYTKTNDYTDEIQLLTGKITINSKQKNTLAVKRDEIKLQFLVNKRTFENVLIQIVLAKQEYKNKEYFENLLLDNINALDMNFLDSYTKLYEDELKSNNTISKAFTSNYQDLSYQNQNQFFILNYLYNNVSKYRKTNFFIDEFNLQYFVKTIDSIRGISFISNLTSYYLKFSIGEIVVVLFIILFFRLLNTRIISFLANFVSKLFIKNNDEDSSIIQQYIRMSIDSPLIFSLYTLSIQISIYILIKDPQIIDQIMPWINTLYISLLTWALYAILNNSINIYAHSLLEKYPNVRKEMIVFILRIIKIILILLVILFLFSQLGIDIKAIAASLGVGGIAIALASKDTLANFFSSLNIMTDNSFSQGDWIKTSSIEGTVVDIRMRTTRIRTFDNAMITVPNTQLANSPIINWSKRKIGRRIKMSLGITYESDMKDIKQLKEDIQDMLENHSQIATSKNNETTKSRAFEAIKKEDLQGIKRTLLVYIDEFAPSSINILVYCFTRSPNWEDWLIVKEDVIIKLADLVEKNNCEFAYPTQAILIKKDEEISSMSDI